MPKDYLKAYIDALAKEQAEGDAALQVLLNEKATELAKGLQRPYLEAIRLREKSRALRGELTDGIAAGKPADTLLPLALQTISALCGDEAFYLHNAGLLAARRGDTPLQGAPSGPAPPPNATALKQEYNALLQRIHKGIVFISSPQVPDSQKEQYIETLDAMDTRAKWLLDQIGDVSSAEAAEGFALREGEDP